MSSCLPTSGKPDLFLYCGLTCSSRCNLPAALVRVIVTSDTVLSVRATVLLGQLLHATATILPHEIAATSHCLPELAQHIATSTQVHTILQHSGHNKSWSQNV